MINFYLKIREPGGPGSEISDSARVNTPGMGGRPAPMMSAGSSHNGYRLMSYNTPTASEDRVLKRNNHVIEFRNLTSNFRS